MGKHKKTIGMLNRIIDHISRGSSHRDCCDLVGIDKVTLYAWLNEDEKFSTRFGQAEQNSKAVLVHHWHAAASKNWQAARAFLACKYPKEYASPKAFRLSDVAEYVNDVQTKIQEYLTPAQFEKFNKELSERTDQMTSRPEMESDDYEKGE